MASSTWSHAHRKPAPSAPDAVHYTVPHPSETLADRPEYLLRMKVENLPRYEARLRKCLDILRAIRAELNNQEKAIRLERCLRNALGDVVRVQACKLI